jgi:hypothetical protein
MDGILRLIEYSLTGNQLFEGLIQIKQSGMLNIYLNDLININAFQKTRSFLNSEPQSRFKNVFSYVNNNNFKNKNRKKK